MGLCLLQQLPPAPRMSQVTLTRVASGSAHVSMSQRPLLPPHCLLCRRRYQSMPPLLLCRPRPPHRCHPPVRVAARRFLLPPALLYRRRPPPPQPPLPPRRQPLAPSRHLLPSLPRLWRYRLFHMQYLGYIHRRPLRLSHNRPWHRLRQTRKDSRSTPSTWHWPRARCHQTKSVCGRGNQEAVEERGAVGGEQRAEQAMARLCANKPTHPRKALRRGREMA